MLTTLVAVSAALFGLAASGIASVHGDSGSAVEAGQSVFGEATGVANLDPALLSALRRAATDAAGDGVELHVNSGWRSTEHQAQLLHAAISEYGSQQEASR